VNSGVKRAARPSQAPREQARAIFRTAILEAAEQVFAERGFHGARIHDIAERAKIAVGTVYNHFAQKEDVLAALLDERTEAMIELLVTREEDGPDFAGRLRGAITRVLRYVEERHSFFNLAFEHGLIGPSTAAAGVLLAGRQPRHREKLRRTWDQLLRSGVESGALRAMEPRTLATFFFGALRAHVLVALADPRRHAPEEGAAEILELFLHGAAPHGPTR
jgi:AcrR family transcriptional regulator